MNQNIPIDLDYSEYGWEDHDREEEEIIRQMEGDDIVPKMRSQEQIHTRSHGGGGTYSSQDSSASRTHCYKTFKGNHITVWEYMDVQWEVALDDKKKKMAKCKFCSKVLSANPFGGTRHLKIHTGN